MNDLLSNINLSKVDDGVLEALEYYKAIVELADDSVVILNGHNIVQSNKAFLDLLEYYPKNIRDENFLSFLSTYPIDWKGDLPDNSEKYFVELQTKNGLKPILLSFKRIILGSKNYIIARLRDISVIKNLENWNFLSNPIENINNAAVVTDINYKASTDL